MESSCSDGSGVDNKPLPAETDHVFLAPGFFTLKRSSLRKRKRVSDSFSVSSLDSPFEESRKASKFLKASSLVSMFSPAKSMPKFASTLQRSLDGIHISSPKAVVHQSYNENHSPRRLRRFGSRKSLNSAPSTPCKLHRREVKLWSESISSEKVEKLKQQLSKQEIRRQEAIYELFQGEVSIVNDLQLATKIYRDSLLHLSILSPEELIQIFGTLHKILSAHQELLNQLCALQNKDLVTDSIGKVLVHWIPSLNCYSDYCSNLVTAKELLDLKKSQDKRFQDFLQRCLESSFSRKLDLWNFLDVPRNRLVKYPLLLRNILKLTPEQHEDIQLLTAAIKSVEEIISGVDKEAGKTQCQFFINKIYHINEEQRIPELNTASSLVCSGLLKNNRGTKLDAFLFDTVFVMTRPVMCNISGKRLYQIYHQPIPVSQLVVEILRDGDVKMGSFRATFAAGQVSRNLFKVVDKSSSQTRRFTLQASNEHSKKQWLISFQKLSIGIVYPSIPINDNLNTENRTFSQILLRPRNRHSLPVLKTALSSRTMFTTKQQTLAKYLSTVTKNEFNNPNEVVMSSRSIYI